MTQLAGRTRFGYASIVVSMALALSALPVTAQDEAEPVTLKFLASIPSAAAADAWERFVEPFEAANPNIDVVVETFDDLNTMRSVLGTRISSGEGPDVFTGDTGIAFMGKLVQNGLFRDLTDEYAARGWPTYEWTKPFLAYNGDGRVFEYADELHTIGMYYNKDIFEEQGLEVPTTIAELETVSAALQAEGILPMAFGNKDQWPAGHVWSSALSNALGTEGLNEIIFGDASWDTPENIEAIDLVFRKLVEDGTYNDSVNGLDYNDQNALFLQGGVAMLPTGSWVEPAISSTAEFEVGYVPFPTSGEATYMPFGIGNGWYVSSASQNVDEALAFLDYVVSDEGARARYEAWGNIPAQSISIEGLGASPLAENLFAQIDSIAGSESPTVGYNIDVVTPSSFVEAMFTGFQEVIDGTRTAEEQAKALQEAWATAKANGETLSTAGS